MEKVSDEVDLDEWEVLPDDGFIDLHHHGHGGKGLFPMERRFDQKVMFDMNYFICPSMENSSVVRGSNQLVPVPIRLEPPTRKSLDDNNFVKEIPIVEVSIISPVASEKIQAPNYDAGVDQDTVSQVFFKKMKENEFVDMKMDSPKSGSRTIKPQIELGSIQFEEKEETCKGDGKATSNMTIEQEVVTKNTYLDSNIKEESNWQASGDGGGFSIWRWRPNGTGVLCSITMMAAATICIFIFGSHQKHKHHHQEQNLRFQIYANDKKINQVMHQAARLNQAISAVRGVPLTRAHITFGGYYNGL